MRTDTKTINTLISVYNNSEIIAQYSGKFYIYHEEEKHGCFHFADDKNKHHRIYGQYTIIVDEQEE